ncbi:PLAC8 domain-containing protein/DUF2985 domain-containing protein [Cucumis melo var. makuwa]|uniref:Uncharacterized protein LOC103502180 isoform X1 n=2 Tax=Cucumis melo TaxID=3656 RepID=A0A1S3CMK5_CUCME|nr:uncharacterized protein LOC103502180 [Cucumis melo]XP_016903162.1 uncharacterized protein LOC103502180 [Cucumis melo]KAA0065328.1 PLAC8 domain-containing protein/DUF2985 domain-containing protein [Cucumis melo var. makuwa]
MDSKAPSTLSASYYEHEDKYHDELHRSISQRNLLRSEDSKVGSANVPSPSAKFQNMVERMDEISWSVPSSRGILEQKIKLRSSITFCKEWIKDPLNVALLLWMICVAISGAVLFLVMTGMLNNLLPSKSRRDVWFEVNNQFLTALFTLMCLYHHPKRIHHVILLCRWKPGDILTLQKVYCKNGTYKPNEWKHMMVLLLLLHINCFAQYALSSLNLRYKKPERSVFGVSICLAVAILAAAGAGLYSIFSPLGKEYSPGEDEKNPNQIKESISFASRIADKPQWRGELFHFLDDIKTACLSLFCSFCLFGWNMERLGFGNTYVHITTFVIFCSAPLCLFGLAANTVDPWSVKVAFCLIGILLSVFGLLYGGYWRIQMRKRFDLPKNNSFWGKPNVADCAQWLFCCCCSLAQEVRTADYYETMKDNLCKNRTSHADKNEDLSPLPREGRTVHGLRSNLASPIWDSVKLTETMAKKDLNSNRLLDETDEVEQLMNPPTIASMQRNGFELKMTKNLAGERPLSL